MADVNEMLSKYSKKLNSSSEKEPKKIERRRATRSWSDSANHVARENSAALDPLISSNEAPIETSANSTLSSTVIAESGLNGVLESSINEVESVTNDTLLRNEMNTHYVTNEDSLRNKPDDNSVTNNNSLRNKFIDLGNSKDNGDANCVTNEDSLRNKPDDNYVTNKSSLRNASPGSYVTDDSSLRNKTNQTVTKSSSLRNKEVALRNELVTERVTQSVTDSVTKSGSLRNESSAKHNATVSIHSVSKNKRLILEAIFNLCVENNDFKTAKVAGHSLESLLGIKSEVIRVTCVRLINEGLLEIVESKQGNGGYRIFQLPMPVYQQILQSQGTHSVTKSGSLRNESVTQRVTQSVTNSPSKLVSKNINTNYLSNDSWFLKLDFTSIPGVRAASINKSIRENVEANLDEDTTQDFLNRFMPWLATQSNVRNPLALLCDKLKEFAEIKDSPVLAVQTTEEIEIEAAMAESAAKLRSQMDLIAKNREAEQEHKLNAEFEAFYQSATDEELIALASPTAFSILRSETHKRTVKEVYLQNLNK